MIFQHEDIIQVDFDSTRGPEPRKARSLQEPSLTQVLDCLRSFF